MPHRDLFVFLWLTELVLNWLILEFISGNPFTRLEMHPTGPGWLATDGGVVLFSVFPQAQLHTHRAQCHRAALTSSFVSTGGYLIFCSCKVKIGCDHVPFLWLWLQQSFGKTNFSLQEKCPRDSRTRWPQTWDDVATCSETSSQAFSLLFLTPHLDSEALAVKGEFSSGSLSLEKHGGLRSWLGKVRSSAKSCCFLNDEAAPGDVALLWSCLWHLWHCLSWFLWLSARYSVLSASLGNYPLEIKPHELCFST